MFTVPDAQKAADLFNYATAAYGGQLTEAKRTLIFFKPSTLVVVDQLASTTPRQWEWNIHTLNPLVQAYDVYKTVNDTAEMNIQIVADDALGRGIWTGYQPPPQLTDVATHYRNMFYYLNKKSTGLFVSVIRMDSSTPKAKITFSNGGTRIEVGAYVVSFSGDIITIEGTQP